MSIGYLYEQRFTGNQITIRFQSTPVFDGINQIIINNTFKVLVCRNGLLGSANSTDMKPVPWKQSFTMHLSKLYSILESLNFNFK